VWLYALGLLFVLVTVLLPQGVVGLLGKLRLRRKAARTVTATTEAP